MKPIIQLLHEIRGRVPMYVGTNSVSKLANFVRGYCYALEKHGLCETDHFLLEFQEFVQTRYGITISRGWADIILFQSADDNEAIDLFWRLFDDYCDAKDVKSHDITQEKQS